LLYKIYIKCEWRRWSTILPRNVQVQRFNIGFVVLKVVMKDHCEEPMFRSEGNEDRTMNSENTEQVSL